MSYMEGILTFSEKSGKHSDMINTIPKCLHSLITTVSVPNKRGQGLRSKHRESWLLDPANCYIM